LDLTSSQAKNHGLAVKQNGQTRTAYGFLSHKGFEIDTLIEIWPEFKTFNLEIREQLKNEASYSVYVERQKKDVENMRKDLGHKIPVDFNYSNINNLSSELKLKLQKIRPENLDQASRIDGMTPVALTLILGQIKSYNNIKTA